MPRPAVRPARSGVPCLPACRPMPIVPLVSSVRPRRCGAAFPPPRANPTPTTPCSGGHRRIRPAPEPNSSAGRTWFGSLDTRNSDVRIGAGDTLYERMPRCGRSPRGARGRSLCRRWAVPHAELLPVSAGRDGSSSTGSARFRFQVLDLVSPGRWPVLLLAPGSPPRRRVERLGSSQYAAAVWDGSTSPTGSRSPPATGFTGGGPSCRTPPASHRRALVLVAALFSAAVVGSPGGRAGPRGAGGWGSPPGIVVATLPFAWFNGSIVATYSVDLAVAPLLILLAWRARPALVAWRRCPGHAAVADRASASPWPPCPSPGPAGGGRIRLAGGPRGWSLLAPASCGGGPVRPDGARPARWRRRLAPRHPRRVEGAARRARARPDVRWRPQPRAPSPPTRSWPSLPLAALAGLALVGLGIRSLVRALHHGARPTARRRSPQRCPVPVPAPLTPGGPPPRTSLMAGPMAAHVAAPAVGPALVQSRRRCWRRYGAAHGRGDPGAVRRGRPPARLPPRSGHRPPPRPPALLRPPPRGRGRQTPGTGPGAPVATLAVLAIAVSWAPTGSWPLPPRSPGTAHRARRGCG